MKVLLLQVIEKPERFTKNTNILGNVSVVSTFPDVKRKVGNQK